jgi:hypothetical protein
MSIETGWIRSSQNEDYTKLRQTKSTFPNTVYDFLSDLPKLGTMLSQSRTLNPRTRLSTYADSATQCTVYYYVRECSFIHLPSSLDIILIRFIPIILAD